jgi:hypothetical protein
MLTRMEPETTRGVFLYLTKLSRPGEKRRGRGVLAVLAPGVSTLIARTSYEETAFPLAIVTDFTVLSYFMMRGIDCAKHTA